MKRVPQDHPIVVEDGYEPGTVGEAWSEYQRTHPGTNPDAYQVFRSGWRRGFGQGSVVATTTFVHERKAEL